MTIPFRPFDEDDQPVVDDLDDLDDFLDLPVDTTAEQSVEDLDAGGPDADTTGDDAAAAEGAEAGQEISDADREAFVAALRAAAEKKAAERPVNPNHPVAEGDESALGAAKTLSKAEAMGTSNGSKDAKPPKSTSARRKPKSRPILGLVLVVAAAVALALVPTLRSTFERTPRDRFGISYGGGPIEGVHFQKIVEPGSGLFFNGIFDSLYLYPADQLNYIVADTPGTDGEEGTKDAIVAPTSDRVAVSYQVAVYYKLNTDQLREFHEQLGLRYQAFTDAGWKRLIRDTMRQQIESALQEETRRHTVADIYGNAERLVQIQQEVQVTLSARLEAALGGRYFCGPTFEPGGNCGDPTFVIKRTDIPKAVADAFESNRTSEVLIATKENEVKQREQEARGIAALSEALEQSGPAYVLLKAIESGKIDFWVLPDDGSVNLTAPAAPAGAAE